MRICIVATLVGLCLGCSPPAPVSNTVRVSARSEHWQRQIVGDSPGAGVNVRRGDRIRLDIRGEIVYGKSLGGLRSRHAGPWGARSRPLSDEYYCPGAHIGALVWRIGEDGPCAWTDAEGPVEFVANRDGELQLMVNDRRGKYGDNSGAFTVGVTVLRK